jgi:hypothetical protein
MAGLEERKGFVLQSSPKPAFRWGLQDIRWPLLALAILILFHLSINIIWAMQDLAPPWWDQAGYYWGNLRLWEKLDSGGIFKFLGALLKFKDRSPLFNGVAVPFFAVFGAHETAGMVVVWGAFALLLIMVYKIGALYGGRETGVLAALLTSCMPLIYSLSRQFLAEIPLAAVAASMAYQGIYSAGFQKRKPAIYCGLLLGLGLLLKVTFIVYGAGIVAGVIAQRLRTQQLRELWSKGGMRDLLWGVGPALALASFWYIRNYKVALQWIVDSGYGRIIKLYGPQSLWDYYMVLINYGMSAYIFLTGVLAFVLSLFLRNSNEKFPPVALAWFLLPLGVFSASASPDTRHLAPVLPAVAVLISVWIARLFSAKQLRWFIGLYAVFPMYTAVQYSLSDVATVRRGGPFVFWGRDNHYLYKPVAADWKNEEIVHTLQTLARDPKQPLRVALAADEKYFESNWFNFLALRRRARLSFVGIPWMRPDFSLETFVQEILDCDFLIMKSVDSEPGSLHVNHITQYNNELRAILQNEQLPFVRVSDLTVLPDGSRVFIYQKVSGSPGFSLW